MLLVTFPIGEQTYGLSAEDLREIIPWPELRPLDATPSWVRGVLIWRGELTPVIDLCGLFGQDLCADRLSTRVMIVPAGPRGQIRPLGLLAEKLTDAVTAGADAAEPCPVAQGDQPCLGPLIRLPGGELIQQIRPRCLVDEKLHGLLYPDSQKEAS